METSLRPLTLGEILDRTAQLYRSHFWLFAGIASVYSGAILVLGLLQIGVQQVFQAEHLARDVIFLAAIGLVIQFFVSFVVGGLAMAANNRAVAWVHLGEPATIRGAYGGILPHTGRYLWLMTIIAFLMWTPLALAYGGYVSVLFFWIRPMSKGARALANSGAAQGNHQAAIMLGLATILFFVLFAIALAYAVIMGLRYSLAIPSCVVENLKARQAIRRSIELSKGSRGRIFVLALLVIVIQTGLVLVTQLAFILLSLRHGQLSVGARIAQQLVAFITNTFIGPMYATGFTLFYYDQRVRKEGYDIEWMMQAAGLTHPDGPDSGSAHDAPADPAPLPDQTEPA
jgi:uncharacterized membrane protein